MKNFEELNKKELRQIEGGLPFLAYAAVALVGFLWAWASRD